MGDDLKQIEERINQYGRFMAQAQPVNWVKAAKNQPISSLACDNTLLVFLLNPAYMQLDVDGKTVALPLERPLCEGAVTLRLPEELTVRRCRTLLGGKALRFTSENGQTTVPFSFRTGGEMLIVTLSGPIEPATCSPTPHAVDVIRRQTGPYGYLGPVRTFDGRCSHSCMQQSTPQRLAGALVKFRIFLSDETAVWGTKRANSRESGWRR